METRKLNERTFWVSFNPTVTPKHTRSSIFKYTTITVMVNEEEFFAKNKHDQKECLINEAKKYIIDWYTRRKYKQSKKAEDLTFIDGATTVVYKNFKVNKPFEINGI